MVNMIHNLIIAVFTLSRFALVSEIPHFGVTHSLIRTDQPCQDQHIGDDQAFPSWRSEVIIKMDYAKQSALNSLQTKLVFERLTIRVDFISSKSWRSTLGRTDLLAPVISENQLIAQSEPGWILIPSISLSK
jgi:hypothetical protein